MVEVGPSGVTATATSSFTTLTPTAFVGMSVSPDSGLSVGVGQPIDLQFTHHHHPVEPTDVADSTAAVDVDSCSVGAYWFSPTELHLRAGELLALRGADQPL